MQAQKQAKSQERLLTPLRQDEYMSQTMKQIINYSPDYKLNKLNNYDNTV